MFDSQNPVAFSMSVPLTNSTSVSRSVISNA